MSPGCPRRRSPRCPGAPWDAAPPPPAAGAERGRGHPCALFCCHLVLAHGRAPAPRGPQGARRPRAAVGAVGKPPANGGDPGTVGGWGALDPRGTRSSVIRGNWGEKNPFSCVNPTGKRGSMTLDAAMLSGCPFASPQPPPISLGTGCGGSGGEGIPVLPIGDHPGTLYRWKGWCHRRAHTLPGTGAAGGSTSPRRCHGEGPVCKPPPQQSPVGLFLHPMLASGFPPFLPRQPSFPEMDGLTLRSIPADSGVCALALTEQPAAFPAGLRQ